MRSRTRFALLATVVSLCGAWCAGQEISASGRVTVGSKSPAKNSSVVWLTPVKAGEAGKPAPVQNAVLRQKNKTFEPHLLVVTVGTDVQFPNEDPWFHNVFSLFNGKRFDLGLYEAGSSRTVRFDHEGVSYIFCNIHPEMSAVVVALPTNYFALPDREGNYTISGLAPGRYVLHVWSENAQPATLLAVAHEVQVSNASHTLGTLRVPADATPALAHKNKYGQDYEPPKSDGVYARP